MQFLECEDYSHVGLVLPVANRDLMQTVLNAVQQLTNVQLFAEKLKLVLAILVPELNGKMWGLDKEGDATAHTPTAAAVAVQQGRECSSSEEEDVKEDCDLPSDTAAVTQQQQQGGFGFRTGRLQWCWWRDIPAGQRQR